MNNLCAVCGVSDSNKKLFRCAKCKSVCYCSKEHQRLDWKFQHKLKCVPHQIDRKQDNASVNSSNILLSSKEADKRSKTLKEKSMSVASGSLLEVKHSSRNTASNIKSWDIGLFTDEGSSESEILKAGTETLRTDFDFTENNENKEDIRGFAEISLNGSNLNSAVNTNILEEVSLNVVHDMDEFGVCVVDHFLGPDLGCAVLDEVVGMYERGVFKDGQTVSSTGDVKNIRRDKIVWLDGKESHCKNIGTLIAKVDTVIQQANKMMNNGKMGSYVINGRTKAMVACYPAQGSHYVKHVDNPNHDGRCITAIYYLNKDWNVQKDGGLLRIFPQGCKDKVADIVPDFDRILFFWSDRRNPHEVQPSYRTRYAITLWYFDANEREEATKKYIQQQKQTAVTPS